MYVCIHIYIYIYTHIHTLLLQHSIWPHVIHNYHMTLYLPTSYYRVRRHGPPSQPKKYTTQTQTTKHDIYLHTH